MIYRVSLILYYEIVQTYIQFKKEKQKMNKDKIKKILEEFRTADIPRYDFDDSRKERSRTYCGIEDEHKEQIYKWLKERLLE